MRYVVVALMALSVTGCMSRAQPSTPLEAEEQETRMRNALTDTSPRNMTDVPKATHEFYRGFGKGKTDVPPPIPTDIPTRPNEIKENIE